jgi:hypothetical protein
MDATRRRCGLKGGSTTRGSNTSNATRQQHDNWEQHKILAFIKCKHDEHATQKAFVDPKTHIILVAQR